MFAAGASLSRYLNAGTRVARVTAVSRRNLLEVAAVGLAYYGAARLGLAMELPGTDAPAVWPASGIALTAMLLLGRHVWPGIAAAAFLATAFTLPSTTIGLAAAILSAAGNTLEQVVALAIIRRTCQSRNPFETARDALWFVAAAGISAAIAATTGVTARWLVGASLHESAWVTWLVSDMAGIVIVTPALFSWGRNPRLSLSPLRAIELAGVAGLLIIAVGIVFSGRADFQLATARPLLPLLLWAAFRFGQREASTLALLASGQVVFQTWRVMQSGVAGASDNAMAALFITLSATPSDWLRALQLFLAATAVVALIVTAALADRDRSQLALQLGERRFRTIFEQAAMGVAVVDTATGRFLRVNQRYCDIVGYEADDLTDMTFQSMTHADDLQADLDHMRRMIDGEIRQFSLEKRFCRRDGSAVWVNLTVSPMWQRGERADHHVAIIDDITVRRQAETDLRMINQTLEERVRERTAQLRDSLEEKETLLREIHHRVKNNLAVVSGLLYLETTRTRDTQTGDVLRESQHRVRSMALVHEVLYRSGNLAAIDFHDYADRLVKYLLPSYGAVSGRVRVQLRMEPLSVDTDAAIPCGLILTELLTNALKHAFPDDRSGTIVISLDRAEDGNHWLVVRDDGIGISPELSADNASTLGWRLVRSLTRQLEGTFTISGAKPGTEAALRFSARTVQPS